MQPDLTDLLGIPFVSGGRDKDGLDCWGTVMEVEKRFGKNVPDYNCDAFFTPAIITTMASVLGSWDKVVLPNPGNVIAFAIDMSFPSATQHFGVVLDRGMFIHCREKTGVIMEQMNHPFWSARCTGFYKWRE